MTDHINGYSLALFSLAQEEKKLTQYKTQATEIVKALNEVEGYEHLLSSYTLDAETKKKMIKEAFGKGLNKNLLNFLYLLVDRNKFKVTKPALNKLVKFINEKENINEGVVYTPIKITPALLSDVTKKVEKVLGIKVSLVNKIDQELLSGFKVIVGDEVIEDNVVSRLEDIRNELLRKEN